MKTPYIYFGQKGYFNTAGVAPTSHVAALATMSIANSGMLPKVNAKDSGILTTALGYRVLVVGGDQVDDVRGTDYTRDFVTGALFNVDGDSDINQDDKFIGQVTELTDTDAYISGNEDGVITIGSNSATAGTVGADATNGFTMTTSDTVIVEQYKNNNTVGNGSDTSELSMVFAYPMRGFRGANPIAYGKTHYDGTVLDQTNLHFEAQTGAGGDEIFTIIHKAGKYPEIVKTMEAIANCGVYDRAITFYDLDILGTETFVGGPTLSGNNDLGIVGCFRTTSNPG